MSFVSVEMIISDIDTLLYNNCHPCIIEIHVLHNACMFAIHLIINRVILNLLWLY